MMAEYSENDFRRGFLYGLFFALPFWVVIIYIISEIVK